MTSKSYDVLCPGCGSALRVRVTVAGAFRFVAYPYGGTDVETCPGCNLVLAPNAVRQDEVLGPSRLG